MVRSGMFALLIGTAGVACQAVAVDLNHPVSPRRQLAACMVKRMAASRAISYNQASALCKAQLKPSTSTPALASAVERNSPGGLGK